ncbi:hypothetical protein [Viscerimonas tarda]
MNNYVLVEFPEDAAYFENSETGYPCFNSEDNGARYIPEAEYARHFGHEPQPDACFRPLCWPASQDYLRNRLCEPVIADEKALSDFGSSAVWVPVCLIELDK